MRSCPAVRRFVIAAGNLCVMSGYKHDAEVACGNDKSDEYLDECP